MFDRHYLDLKVSILQILNEYSPLFYFLAPSEPSAKAIATADDGIMLYIEPGEGKTEQFEIIVRDVQTKDEIRREIISADERDADGDIRHTITDPELERDQRVDVEVKALSFGKESNAFQINDFVIR